MQIILWEIGILALLLWALAVGFVVFSGILFYRQQVVFRHILGRLKKMDEALASLVPSMTSQNVTQSRLSIMKDEPISKYETVTLPDNVQVSFVEKER